MANEVPRRSRLDLNTPEEKKIYEIISAIEQLGADPLLTDCVNRLLEAKNNLSDWVDKNDVQP